MKSRTCKPEFKAKTGKVRMPKVNTGKAMARPTMSVSAKPKRPKSIRGMRVAVKRPGGM